MAYKYGQMVQDTMVSGRTEWPMDVVVWSMKMVTSTKANGLMIKQRGMVYNKTLMEVAMKVDGKMINSMGMD